MGEKLADFFGVTSPKFQHAIDEGQRMKKQFEMKEIACHDNSTFSGDIDEAIVYNPPKSLEQNHEKF